MIPVLCGLIKNERGELFIARRKPEKFMGGKWEFPGGKREEDEGELECLARELKEEFGMEVEIHERKAEIKHHYDEFSIRLIAYECKFLKATFKLTDHTEYAWVAPEDLEDYDLADADIPFVHLLTTTS